jgi:hypothetical protein
MRFLFPFILLLFFSFLTAQNKWGQLTQDEINLKEVDFEKDADVVILYEKGNATIAGSFQNYIYRRVKILTEKGIDYANQELLYYSDKNIENISNLKAQTINIVNGKPEIFPIEKNLFFDVKINDYYNAKRFAFPNVKVGSILEYEYSWVSKNIHHIDAWQFQHEYPTLYSQFSIENKMTLNYASITIGEKVGKQPKINPKSKENTWRLSRIPSFKKIDYLHNQEDMAERIIFQLSAVNSFNSKVNTITTWKELKQERFEDYQKFLNESIGKEIAIQIPKGNNELENLQNIYNYFKSNYVWNKFIGIYPKQNNRQLIKEKLGNQADLNLLLYSILTQSGFKTDLILLSNRSNGRVLVSYPYLGNFNMMVNLVTMHDGATYIIDAARMEGDLPYPPKDLFNMYAITLKPFDDSFVLLKQEISEMYSLQNYIYQNDKWHLIRTDKRNGHFKENDAPNDAFSAIQNSMDIHLNESKKEKNNRDEKNFQVEKSQFASNLIRDYEFISIENPLSAILSSFKFTETERERYLEFDFPFYYKTDVIINVPAGYKVEVPNGFEKTFQTENKQFLYNQRTSQQEDKFIIQYEFYLSNSVVTDKYVDVKSFFDKVHLNGAKNLLLKKL